MNGLNILSAEITKLLGRELTAEEANNVTKMAMSIAEQSGSMPSTPILTMAEEEVLSLHGTLSGQLQAQGLQGAALDNALSAALKVCVQHIDRDRLAKINRRSGIKVVGQ